MRTGFDHLPDDTVELIICDLQRTDLFSVSLACRRFQALAEPYLWRDLDLRTTIPSHWQESMTGTRIYPSTILAIRYRSALIELTAKHRFRQILRTLDMRPALAQHIRSLRLGTLFLTSPLVLRILQLVKDDLTELELLPDVAASAWRLHVTDHLLQERQERPEDFAGRVAAMGGYAKLRKATLELEITTMPPLLKVRKVSFSIDTVRMQVVLQLLGRCPNVESIHATHLPALSTPPTTKVNANYPTLNHLRRLEFDTNDGIFRGLVGHWVDTSPKLEKLVVGGIVQEIGRWKTTMRSQTCS